MWSVYADSVSQLVMKDSWKLSLAREAESRVGMKSGALVSLQIETFRT